MHALSFYVRKLFVIVASEMGMLELLMVLAALNLVKVVHVKLPYERGVVASLKVVGKYFYESFNVRYDERIARVAPANY